MDGVFANDLNVVQGGLLSASRNCLFYGEVRDKLWTNRCGFAAPVQDMMSMQSSRCFWRQEFVFRWQPRGPQDMSDPGRQNLERVVCSSCVDLFKTHGVLLKPLSHSAEKPRSLAGGSHPSVPFQTPWASEELTSLLVGLVSISGAGIGGSLVLAGMFPVIAACCPVQSDGRKFAEDNPTDVTMMRDLTRELTNQLVGRIRNRLVANGILFDAQRPTVLSGQSSVRVLEARSCPPFGWTSKVGPLYLWFDVGASLEVCKQLATATVEPELKEGDLLLL